MEEILFTSLALISAGTAQGLVKVVLELLRDRVSRDPAMIRRTMYLGAISLVGVVLLGGSAFLFYYYAEFIVETALAALDRAGTRGPVLLAGFGAVAGVFLFLLRKYARVAYGAVEIIVAIIGLAGYPPTAQAGGIPWLISLLALIYILVRGLDNIDGGIKERRDRFLSAA